MAKRAIALPAPKQPVDLLIVAGEHSGDEHAARMVQRIKAAEPGLHIVAIGGRHLKAAGAEQLFDLTLHSVIGIVEVLKNYPFFKSLFNELLRWVEEHRPKNILFVDYPGFNLRVAEQLYLRGLSRKGGGTIGVYYYISPQIWAWKAKRRFKIARWVDALGTLFPFEVDCYEDTVLDVSFVGHPFVGAEYEAPVSYDPSGPILLLPGSRLGPVLRIFPVLLQAFRRYAERDNEIRAAVVYPSEEVKDLLDAILADFADIRERVDLISNEEKATGRAVLMSSGTISLICALAGLPGAIVYRLNTFSYWFGRAVLKVPFIGIENILLRRSFHPEFIQNIDGEALFQELVEAVENPRRREAALEAVGELREILSPSVDRTVDRWLLQRMQDAE